MMYLSVACLDALMLLNHGGAVVSDRLAIVFLGHSSPFCHQSLPPQAPREDHSSD